MTPRVDLLTELEPSPQKHVNPALGQRAEVKGMGKAMFKGADGKMVGLMNMLWVPNLAANLISVRRLQKAAMDTSLKGAKTYTARIGECVLWDPHEDRDVYNEMWQIPVVPMPNERQVAESVNIKGEAVGSGYGANVGARAKESNNTRELVELPQGRKAITSKWLLKIKSDADGKFERYKLRLVAEGYQQKEKMEYKESFAPVVKATTLRT
ncbi:unnamed protein product [Closterium sp. NIES-53]